MKANVLAMDGKKTSDIELPIHFSEPIRSDLIKRAVIAVQSHSYQPYGADPLAGTKQGDATIKNRHKYGTTYGHGISRLKRKRLWTRGSRFGWVAAFVANVRGGRKAFAPQADKVIAEKINKKENRKAIRSAIAATKSIIVEEKFENTNKTKDVSNVLKAIGLNEELSRAKVKKVRAGKGTMRGRRYKRRKGPLVVVSKDTPLLKAAKNIAGLDVVKVNNLNATLLAPGTMPGRITVWTKPAIEKLGKENLFR